MFICFLWWCSLSISFGGYAYYVHVKRALLELEPHYRTVIVLKHLEGFSYREIGELLEIPEKTVKSRLFTARQRLRVILTERGFAP